jgi:hypothetical protein
MPIQMNDILVFVVCSLYRSRESSLRRQDKEASSMTEEHEHSGRVTTRGYARDPILEVAGCREVNSFGNLELGFGVRAV